MSTMNGIIVTKDNVTWEDPFLWYDSQRAAYKIFSHAYWNPSDEPLCEKNFTRIVAGYAFSYDGETWHQSEEEPFTSTVAHPDGTSTTYNTRERHKLVFDGNGQMLALASGMGG
eukprot:gene5306-8096_t